MSKSKNTQKKASGLSWKKVLIILAAVVVLCGLCAGIFAIVKTVSSKNLKVAFYDVPQTVEAALTDKISREYSGKITFTTLSPQDLNKLKAVKKNNLIFTKQGQLSNSLADFARKVPDAASVKLPSKFIKDNGKELPVLLDHWEIAYNRSILSAAGLEHPLNFTQFEAAIYAMKNQVFVPLFCCGSDDSTVLAFTAALVESAGSEPAYSKLCQLLQSASALSEVIDVNLSDTKEELTLRMVLDKIHSWQEDGVLYSKWYSAKPADFTAIAGQNQIGAYFSSLSNHRTYDYSIVSGFDSDRMPVLYTNTKHGIISPSYVCLNLSDSPKYDYILESLVDEPFQKELSAATKLAPVSSRAQACDRQADDVRYLTAACPAGQLPDLTAACFQLDSQKKANMAQQLRDYARSGYLK